MFQTFLHSRFSLHIAVLVTLFFVVCALIFQIRSLWDNRYSSGTQNIAFVLDVSQSMQVQDISKSSRLAAAKEDIYGLASKNSGTDFSLTIFAWESLRVLPFTSDIWLLATILLWINSDNVVKQGSEIDGALQDAVESFWEDKSGIVVVYTDGDDEAFQISSETMTLIEAQDLEVYVVWVGTIEWGPIPTGEVFSSYKTYKWEIVYPKLNESWLKNLAQNIGGKYISLWEYIAIDNAGKTRQASIVFIFLILASISWGVFLSLIYKKIYS